MANGGADRNLLFGVLALQLQLVTQHDLVDAMYEWVRDKGRPLAQILVQNGALEEDARQLLDALVDKHLARKGGDAAGSLASLCPPNAIPAPLRQIADADVQASLLNLATAGEGAPGARTATDAWPPFEAAVGAPTAAGLRFRLLRAHARGGLGQVSVALDEELRREVAVKEIQERYADDPESRARFLLEAEITGRLEHPGIVPVYGLGSRPDGRPFYAMRLIRGGDLKAAIERFHTAGAGAAGQHDLEFRRLLRRFLDACDAVAYAHSRGILHRDLKPGNILLGDYGQTLVVDWGLAKLVQRPESGPGDDATLPALEAGTQTVAGRAIGTPAFMSPEQAAGRLDQLGPATDIYSLGATLYCLLTGRPPFEGDLAAVLPLVQRGDFAAPRQVNPTVSPALEAICLKAMALRPEHRYPSVTALSEDIENWLADRPVSTWPAETVVEARGLLKNFGPVAVGGLTFKVARGAVFALLGGPQSGKSTALAMLAGLVRPDGGAATILGQDCWRQAGPLRRRVGYVPQRPRFFDWMKIADVAWFVAGFQDGGFPDRFGELARGAGLNPSARIRKLSPEQRYRLGYLLAVASGHEVLLLDEPPEGLLTSPNPDPAAGGNAPHGTTVVLASRRFDQAEALATHVGLLHRGKLLVAAPLDELRNRVLRVRLRFTDEPPAPAPLGTVLTQRRRGDAWEAVIQHPNRQALAALPSTPGLKEIESSPLSLQQLYEALVAREES
jgi:ABC-type multidrug transport system ATPase subunit/tRNA A-37 threonylcarbamoyl transferase component Bud32